MIKTKKGYQEKLQDALGETTRLTGEDATEEPYSTILNHLTEFYSILFVQNRMPTVTELNAAKAFFNEFQTFTTRDAAYHERISRIVATFENYWLLPPG